MAAVGIGVSKVLEGPRSPELTGPNDWSFIDSSQSLVKLNEVGPNDGSGGPSTLHIVIGLILTLVTLMVLTPLVKLFISFKQLFGCCKSGKREVYTVSHPDKDSAVASITFKPDTTPRYTLPPLPDMHHARHWDKVDTTSAPENAISDSNLSSGSVISMENAYQLIGENKDVPEESPMESPKEVCVLFIKSGSLRDTLNRCRQDAEERIMKAEE